MAKKPNPWAQLTAEQKQQRVDRMLEARRANKGKAPKAGRKALPAEVEHLVIPMPHDGPPRRNGMGSMDDLADLIIAIWRRL